VKIVERLTKGESKKKKRNKSHEASYILVEVGGTSTFVTHDVTKVEVKWAEIHLKLKSHTPKERGCLTPRTSAGLSCPGPVWALPAQGRAGAGPGQGLGWPCWPRARPGPSPMAEGEAWTRARPGRGRGLALVMAVAVAVIPKFYH
jgi:hypothetical protein